MPSHCANLGLSAQGWCMQSEESLESAMRGGKLDHFCHLVVPFRRLLIQPYRLCSNSLNRIDKSIALDHLVNFYINLLRSSALKNNPSHSLAPSSITADSFFNLYTCVEPLIVELIKQQSGLALFYSLISNFGSVWICCFNLGKLIWHQKELNINS